MGEGRVQEAEWIVGKACQMDDRLEAANVIRRDVAQVAGDGRHLGAGFESAPPEQTAVQPHDVMSGFVQR